MSHETTITKARQYYDSGDADNFYFHIWGGEDIHIGLYQKKDDPISGASRKTVEHMTALIGELPASARVLDIGSGYGGSARYLARERGCHVTCLNLSAVQNERNRQMNSEQGLSDRIDVVEGNFEELPFPESSFDVVWSQDAILHSGQRKKVFEEVNRVLKPGGLFVFTDPMQKPGVSPEILQPVLNRIDLDSMGSVEVYREYAGDLGWETVSIEEQPDNLIRHYSRVREELTARKAELSKVCSTEYIEKMTAGLGHWVKAGEQGALNWGFLLFRKQS